MDLTQFFSSYWWIALIILVVAAVIVRNIIRFLMTLAGVGLVFFAAWYVFFR